MRKLLGKLIGVHILIGGDQHLSCAVFDEGQISAPLVLYPHRVEILCLRSEHHHDLCGIECRKNIGLVGCAKLIFKGDTGKKHLIALTGKLMVKLRCKNAVLCSAAVIISFFIANKCVEGFFSA